MIRSIPREQPFPSTGGEVKILGRFPGDFGFTKKLPKKGWTENTGAITRSSGISSD
jgi:hypothetical protein